jgi:hypothetical protein
MKTITYDGVTYHCTLTDRFRRHTDAERDAMRESIMADGVGVRHPIRVYRDTTLGLPNCVLDGEGRLEIVAACGYGGAPFHDEGELTTDEAYELAKVDNDHRRQDDPEAVRKRRVERVAVKRSEGKSLQVIADEEQVSKSQVRRDIEEAKSQPVEESEHRTVPPPAQLNPKKVVGKDGKTRTATPKKSAAPPVSAELVGKVAAALRKNPAATDHDLTTLTGCTPAEAKAARKAAKKLTPADEPAPAAPPPDPAKPHPLDVPALTGVYTPRVVVTRPGHQVVLDAYDNPTPPGVGDCFADPALRERFMAITAAAEVLEDEYKHLIKDKSGHDPAKQFPWVEIPALQDHVTTARNALVAAADLIRAGFPHGVCPKCWGEKCKECRLSGFWPRPVCEKHAALFQKRKGA